jgi:hypothetical protein
MKLTRFQTLCLACFVASLLPAYWFANWRHEAQLENLNDMLEKEQALHASADKLMSNCETIAARQTDTYNATHQICNQGNDIHTRTEQTMAALAQDKAANDIKWYRNFALIALLFNFFAFLFYRANIYLNREKS